jgi:hypothetical protein
MSQTQAESAREAVLKAKDAAHASNSSNAAVTDDERTELNALIAKE